MNQIKLSGILSRIQKFYFSRSRQGTVLLFGTIGLLTLTFQNCGQGLQGANHDSSAGSITSLSSNGGDPNITDAQKRINCAANFNPPTLNPLSPSSVTMASGIGNLTGDVPSTNITYSFRSNIKSSTVQSANNCATYTVDSVRCDVVVDTAHPAQFTQAFSLDGSDLTATATTNTAKANLANMAIDLNNCDMTVDTNRTLQIRLNHEANCVQGSFYVRVRIAESVAGTTLNSADQFIPITMRSGCWNETRLKPTSGTFPRISGVGTAASIDGNWAVALADNAPLGSTSNVGALHVFNFNGSKWNFHGTLQLSDALSGESLSAVVVKGDTIVASSAYRAGHGAVIIYKLSGLTWTRSQIINPPVLQADQLFGKSLAFDGSTLVVGAPHYSRSPGDRAGRVYVYRSSDSFSTYQALDVSDSSYANKGFGMSVSVSGSLLAVGAPQAITKESLGRGDVRIFQSNAGTWSQVAVKAPAGTGIGSNMGARYGASVALVGTQLLIGVPNHAANAGALINAGAALYFSSYSLTTATRSYTGGDQNGFYGASVAIGSTGLFVSGPKRDDQAGYVDYYSMTNLANVAYRMISTNRTLNDQLGSAVAIANSNGKTWVMLGARVKDDPEVDSGAAYIYEMK